MRRTVNSCLQDHLLFWFCRPMPFQESHQTKLNYNLRFQSNNSIPKTGDLKFCIHKTKEIAEGNWRFGLVSCSRCIGCNIDQDTIPGNTLMTFNDICVLLQQIQKTWQQQSSKLIAALNVCELAKWTIGLFPWCEVKKKKLGAHPFYTSKRLDQCKGMFTKLAPEAWIEV